MDPSVAVAVLGLGRLGAPLARLLAAAGHRVTVWNRSPGPAYAFEGTARVARDATAACAAADLLITTLSDYGSTLEALDEAAGAGVLEGRTLLQLAGGTAVEARTLAAWAGMLDLAYLDGTLCGDAASLGAPGALLLCAGDEGTFARWRHTLESAVPATRHVGEDVGAAATLGNALAAFVYGARYAMLQGAALATADGQALAPYFALLRTLLPRLAPLAEDARAMIERENYAGAGNPLAFHLAATRQLQRASHDTDIDTRFADLIAQACRKAVAAGHGSDEFPALYELLRRAGSA